MPIIIHGDGVEFLDTDSLEVQSFGPLLGTGDSLDCMFLMAAYPKSCAVKPSATCLGTWHRASKVITWSLTSLLKGCHPSLEEGKPLTDPLMKSLAGKKFPFRFVVWAITGDHEHHSNHYRLPHWSSHKWCWNCDCDRADPCKNGLQLDKLEAALVERKVEAELAKRMSNHELFKVPGVTAFTVQHDALHVLYNHGVLNHFHGSILHGLLFQGIGKQNVPPAARLAVIWQELQTFYKSKNTSTRLTSLQMSMIINPDKPHSEYPSLKTKASETKHLMDFFVQLTKQTLDGSDQNTWKYQAAAAIRNFCYLLDSSPVVPSAQEAAKAERFMKVFFGKLLQATLVGKS